MRKLFCVLLTLFIVGANIVPQKPSIVYAHANKDASEIDTSSEESIPSISESEHVDPYYVPVECEMKSKRAEFEKHYRKIDGRYEVAIYDVAVHYYENGEWKDIDNSLSYDRVQDTYQNAANKFKIDFPNTLDQDSQIVLVGENYSVKWKVMKSKQSIADVGISDTDTNAPNNIKKLDNVRNSVSYRNAIDNASIEYVLSGSNVKENIILERYTKDFSVTFEYELEGLDLKDSPEYGISLVDDKGNEVFRFAELIMYDVTDSCSTDIEYRITKNGNIFEITIMPNDGWLANALYPVSIDPTLLSSSTSMGIDDTYISKLLPNSNYDSSSAMFLSGLISALERRGLIRFEIPTSIMDKVITYSYLEFTKRSVSAGSQLNIYKNVEPFSANTATWNNAPEYDLSVVDYYVVDPTTPFIFDITEAVKEWQAEGVSTIDGFTIAHDNGYGSNNSVYQVNEGGSVIPVITIGYEEPAGLKDYWTYTSQDMGIVGTGYISDYTGNLTWVRNEYSLNNEFMPLTLSFFFNNYSRYDDIGYGYGWRTNYSIQILYDDTASMYYMHKPDGNKVYFVYLDSELVYSGTYAHYYIAEDGR